jgi:hypothetical protein
MHFLGVDVFNNEWFAKFLANQESPTQEFVPERGTKTGRMGYHASDLTKLDLFWGDEGKFRLDILHRDYNIPDKILPVYLIHLNDPYDLGRFPALRHFKIQLPSSLKNDIPILSFLLLCSLFHPLQVA